MEMKNIRELGLETIQLDDQVLLVDENSKNQNIVNVQINGFRRVFEIIASTKPLEGIPLLVIEDELAEHEIFMIKAGISRDDIINWKKGYKYAKETFKYTEEDLSKAYYVGRENGYEVASKETYLDSNEIDLLEKEQNEDYSSFVKNLTKKELWIEVEEKSIEEIEIELGIYGHDEGLTESEYSEYIKKNNVLKLKITDNKIKAVWK